MDEQSSPRSRRRRRHDESASSDSSSSSLSSSDDSSSEEERRRKRRRKEKKSHHTKRREEKHKSKSEKRKKRKHDDGSDEKRKKKSHHGSEDSESESERRKKKRLLKEAKKILKNQKSEANKSEGQQSATAKNVEKISEDDYFVKSNEFATWLKESRGLYFSDLSSEQSRRLFVNFVDAWNAGKLRDTYYAGIKTAKRSNHKWNFEDDQVDKEEEWLQKKKKEKMQQKVFHKEHELVMDELLPKATGRERLLEKKAIQREKNRARDTSPEPMRESDIMGGGDDFKQMLARERARREKKAAEKAGALQKKLSVVEERETVAMDQFRALVNTAGGKITIPRRV